MKITKGTLLILEAGEYSDKEFHGPFKVLRAFDQTEVKARFKAERAQPSEWPDEDIDHFMIWLTRERYIEPAPKVFNWHVGSYGWLESEPNNDVSKLEPNP